MSILLIFIGCLMIYVGLFPPKKKWSKIPEIDFLSAYINQEKNKQGINVVINSLDQDKVIKPTKAIGSSGQDRVARPVATAEPKYYIDMFGYQRFYNSDKLVHRWMMEKCIGRKLHDGRYPFS